MGLVAIANFAEKNGIPVDEAFFSHVLEEAVKVMKEQQSPLLSVGDYLLDIDEAN